MGIDELFDGIFQSIKKSLAKKQPPRDCVKNCRSSNEVWRMGVKMRRSFSRNRSEV